MTQSGIIEYKHDKSDTMVSKDQRVTVHVSKDIDYSIPINIHINCNTTIIVEAEYKCIRLSLIPNRPDYDIHIECYDKESIMVVSCLMGYTASIKCNLKQLVFEGEHIKIMDSTLMSALIRNATISNSKIDYINCYNVTLSNSHIKYAYINSGTFYAYDSEINELGSSKLITYFESSNIKKVSAPSITHPIPDNIFIGWSLTVTKKNYEYCLSAIMVDPSESRIIPIVDSDLMRCDKAYVLGIWNIMGCDIPESVKSSYSIENLKFKYECEKEIESELDTRYTYEAGKGIHFFLNIDRLLRHYDKTPTVPGVTPYNINYLKSEANRLFLERLKG